MVCGSGSWSLVSSALGLSLPQHSHLRGKVGVSLLSWCPPPLVCLAHWFPQNYRPVSDGILQLSVTQHTLSPCISWNYPQVPLPLYCTHLESPAVPLPSMVEQEAEVMVQINLPDFLAVAPAKQ